MRFIQQQNANFRIPGARAIKFKKRKMSLGLTLTDRMKELFEKHNVSTN